MLKPYARTVKPRNRRHKVLPVIAISRGEFLDENGNRGLVRDLINELPKMKPTLFARLSAADFVAELDDVYRGPFPDHWQWRASVNERDICQADGVRLASHMSVVIHFFGWKNGNYHKIVDPVTMYGRDFKDIWPGGESHLSGLLEWAVCLRNFCQNQAIEVRPTTGSLAAQFLTDGRFYNNPRRKVPACINAAARPHMPGNYYQLFANPSPRHEFTAYYLDQHQAHHYHASTVPLPDSDTLYAHGSFTDGRTVSFDSTWEDFYGLYCLDVEGPAEDRWSRLNGNKRVFVFSNELQHLRDAGYRVTGVRAAWGSANRDNGLPKYATWARGILADYDNPAWLKQLLLATYGLLATTPRTRESIFRLASQGDTVQLQTGHKHLTGTKTKATRKLEPAIANVIQRGMIEAATRSESIGLAEWLTSKGHRILSIYADAVIVEVDDDNPLPALPEPWRHKDKLNHLQFINQQAFISGEMTKLPGVSRELMAYRQGRRGKAPRERVMYEALSGREIKVRIGKKK